MDLSTVRNRDRLKPRREPFWQSLGSGRQLGFRPSTSGHGGNWIAKLYNPDTRKRAIKSLGDFPGIPPSDQFSLAKREAEAWFTHLDGGGTKKATTVGEACERYAKPRPDVEGRFKRRIYEDDIAKIAIQKLTKDHVRKWRQRLEAAPARITRSNEGDQQFRPRAPGSVNRDMTALRAALNEALDHSEALNDQAWRMALRPIENADRRRNIYLDRDERRALLAKLPDDVGRYARGLSLLPLRPGAIAALVVANFDARRNELTIGKDKSGDDRRILLPAATAAYFKEQAKGKTPAAPIFARADGSAWNRDSWKGPIKAAVHAAQLPPATTAYTLRHSTITDLVTSGLDLLTVAQVSGTSVAMIERHYGHLQRKRAADALAGLAL
jgi:site-specific recombinase XerD